MLKRDFQALRGGVLAAARSRLRAGGMTLDDGDLEACYATAWQGLYAIALQGEEVANPRGWLVLVTYRRAVEEHRARRRREARLVPVGAVEPDLDAGLDDRMALYRLLEGMRARLDVREREAAALCYLQGYSRAQAAQRMGISETRMRKLMEGRGRGQAGVAGKVGALVETIREGTFCEEQASLMRALAYGVLDPDGERYRLAVMHRRQCPACRRYVASLRNVAAVLPPVLTHPGLSAGALAGLAGVGHAGAGAGAGAVGAGGRGAASLAGPGSGTQAGALGTTAAAGTGGAAGAGWMLGAGGIGAKLAVGCLLALGIGVGCVALQRGPRRVSHPSAARRLPARSPALPGTVGASSVRPRPSTAAAPSARRLALGHAPGGGQMASREFGPEQPAGSGSPVGPTRPRGSVGAASAGAAAASALGTGASGWSKPSGGSEPAAAGSSPPAVREFSPG